MDDERRPRKLQKTEDGSAIALEPVAPNSEDGATHEQASTSEDDGPGDPHDDVDGPKDAPAENGTDGAGLSKNQLKKLRRRQEWEAGKEGRKQKRKEKARAKKERQRAARAEQAQNPAGTEGLAQDETTQSTRATTKSGRGRSVLLPITLLLDCDFDDLMTDKEIVSLSSQLTRCYADNSKAAYRAHLVISSFNKKLKERFDTVFNKQHEQWKGVTVTQEDYVLAGEAAHGQMRDHSGGNLAGALANQAESASPEQGEIIYLTSDSPDTLTELKPYNTYVIGGLVDKNRHKGICYKRAMSRDVKTARLPIGDYMQMASRFVLTTNHVLEIMLKWLELGDWGEAFTWVMPKRKGGRLKREEEEECEPEDADKECEPADEGSNGHTAVATSETPEVAAS